LRPFIYLHGFWSQACRCRSSPLPWSTDGIRGPVAAGLSTWNETSLQQRLRAKRLHRPDNLIVHAPVPRALRARILASLFKVLNDSGVLAALEPHFCLVATSMLAVCTQASIATTTALLGGVNAASGTLCNRRAARSDYVHDTAPAPTSPMQSFRGLSTAITGLPSGWCYGYQ
jgi:hypothetical protein